MSNKQKLKRRLKRHFLYLRMLWIVKRGFAEAIRCLPLEVKLYAKENIAWRYRDAKQEQAQTSDGGAVATLRLCSSNGVFPQGRLDGPPCG